jgi:hypothetical protein
VDAVEAEVVVEILTHAVIETLADHRHEDVPLRIAMGREMLTRTLRAVVVEVEEVAEVAPDPDRSLGRSHGPHPADTAATDRQVQNLQGLAAHLEGAGAAQVQPSREVQEPVADLLNPPPDQSHHTHEHPEDAAT